MNILIAGANCFVGSYFAKKLSYVPEVKLTLAAILVTTSIPLLKYTLNLKYHLQNIIFTSSFSSHIVLKIYRV